MLQKLSLNKNNRIIVNTLSQSTNVNSDIPNLQRYIGGKRIWENLRKWENFKKIKQSIENSLENRMNNHTTSSQENLSQRNINNNSREINSRLNDNYNNNSQINFPRSSTRSYLTNNNNSNFNDYRNNSTNNINVSPKLNSRYGGSISSEYHRIRRKCYFGKQLNKNFLYQMYGTQGDYNNQNLNNNINRSINNNRSNFNLRNHNLNNNIRTNLFNNSNFHRHNVTDNINDYNSNLNNISEIKKDNKKNIKEDFKEEEYKEGNLSSVIKNTVKCHICLNKIIKPKMCPNCNRIACEKCLFNWFNELKKKKCNYCGLETNFNKMISVPFMDTVVNFMEKILKKDEKLSDTVDKEYIEYCPQHKNEILYYYCLNCETAYCKTCFVFFGEEKDKHLGHKIIEYKKYKYMNLPILKENIETLESNIQNIEENIKICLSYKKSYEHEREIGNKFIENLKNQFNKKFDEIIFGIDLQVKKLKEYINEFNKYKKDIQEFISSMKYKKNINDKSCENLINEFSKISQEKSFSSDLEKLNNLSKNLNVSIYQSNIKEINLKNNSLKTNLKIDSNTSYEILIDYKKGNEIGISLKIPKESNSINHNFQAFIVIKNKNRLIQNYDLDEFKEEENYFYLNKKISSKYLGNSLFELKGVLYDYYFS